jgi:hypothetical protein
VKHKFIGKTGYAKFDFDVTCQRYIERDGGDDDFMKTNKIPEKDYPLSWQQEWEKQKEDDEDPF